MRCDKENMYVGIYTNWTLLVFPKSINFNLLVIIICVDLTYNEKKYFKFKINYIMISRV